MSDTIGLDAVAGAVTETWLDDSPGKQTVGNDSGEGAFKIGDRVLVIDGAPAAGSYGVVRSLLPGYSTPIFVRLVSGSAFWYKASDLRHEPVPFSLTPEADAALADAAALERSLDAGDGPWSTTPREAWELNIEFACTELAALLIEKQKAYGAAAINNSPYGWKVHVVTRLHEKISRAIELESDEDLVETFGDLAGVALIGQLKAAGLWRESE